MEATLTETVESDAEFSICGVGRDNTRDVAPEKSQALAAVVHWLRRCDAGIYDIGLPLGI